MSELRLYCDLLVQQVEKTKEVTTAGVSNSEVKYCFSQPRAKWCQMLLTGDAYCHIIPDCLGCYCFSEKKKKDKI